MKGLRCMRSASLYPAVRRAFSTPLNHESQLTLYGHARWRPFRNLWLLEELGVPYTRVVAFPGSSKARKVNPFGKVPTLQDGDFRMYESAAINTYLADKFRDSVPLVPPPGTAERGRYEQLVFCVMAELDAQAIWIQRKHEALGKYFGFCPEAVSCARRQYYTTVKVLVKELEVGGEYLLASGFSAADVLFVHCLDWAESFGWPPTEGLPEADAARLTAYLERCHRRPAYAAALALKRADEAAMPVPTTA
eukprot:EG_transcript_18840